MRTFALIPAAGLSRRMGRPKLLLPLRGKTVLEHVLTALQAGGVDDRLVVVAPDNEELGRVAERAGANVLRLEQATRDMRASCEHGLAWLSAHLQPQPDDGWLLVPADHPTINPDLVRALLAAANATTSAVLVPEFQGQRGHPVWIRWQVAAEISKLEPDVGLNQLIRRHADRTLVLDWPDAEILRDLDTPADYDRLVAESRG
jgi:molybdenum cofactor cytidylyltransferase